MSDALAGKIAMVTGASRGIGRAIAHKLAAAGCDVAVNYFNSHDEAEAVCATIRAVGRHACAIQANVGNPQSVEELFAEFRRHFDRLDILVSNAATGGSELGARGIRVNAVSAGVVDTDALRFFPNRESLLSSFAERAPAGTVLTAEDVAGAVYLLCLPEAAMVTGHTLVVDGGFCISG